MSDFPKRLVKDKFKKSYKKSDSLSSLLGRKTREKRSAFEDELAKQSISLPTQSDKPVDSEHNSGISDIKGTVMSMSTLSYFAPAASAPAPGMNPADVEIMNILRNISVVDVLKASTLDIMSKTQAERREIIIAAVHCMCNGPVGVNKITNFPLINGERSIKSMIDCSNRTWKSFCLHLINDLNFDCTQNCYTKDEFGDLWPLCESAMKIRATP